MESITYCPMNAGGMLSDGSRVEPMVHCQDNTTYHYPKLSKNLFAANSED